MNQARKGSKFIYLIEYDLIHDIERRGKTPWEVFKSLIQCGTILETVFDLDSAGTLDDEPSKQLMLEVLYATVMEPDMLEGLVDVPPERVHLIEKNGAIRPLAEPLPPAAQVHPIAPPPVAAVPPEPAPKPVAAMPLAAAPAPQAETTIRLNVSLLDSLMTLAGELVLSRNQLNESLSRRTTAGYPVGRATGEPGDLRTAGGRDPDAHAAGRQPVHQVPAAGARSGARPRQRSAAQVGGRRRSRSTRPFWRGLAIRLPTWCATRWITASSQPADRVAAGKPAMGTVTLSASHQAGQVVIEISDDGKGLAVEKVAASALAKGLVTREQLQTMPERDKMALIFLPGVSTAEKVSDVSGRGVGMDVVKTNLDRLGGKIEIDSAAGPGLAVPHQAAADAGHHSLAAGFRRRPAFRHPAGERGRADPHSRGATGAAHRPRGRCRGSERARPAGAAAVSGGCAGSAAPAELRRGR